jgi:hypothetical protein
VVALEGLESRRVDVDTKSNIEAGLRKSKRSSSRSAEDLHCNWLIVIGHAFLLLTRGIFLD